MAKNVMWAVKRGNRYVKDVTVDWSPKNGYTRSLNSAMHYDKKIWAVKDIKTAQSLENIPVGAEVPVKVKLVNDKWVEV